MMVVACGGTTTASGGTGDTEAGGSGGAATTSTGGTGGVVATPLSTGGSTQITPPGPGGPTLECIWNGCGCGCEQDQNCPKRVDCNSDAGIASVCADGGRAICPFTEFAN
jgi:hypothetical protein